MKQLIVLSLLACIGFGMISCSKPKSFEYRSVKNFKLDKVGFDQTILSMDLVYYNPNNFGVDLRKVDCEVYVNNNFLGRYLLDTMMHIPRQAEFALPSRMAVDMKGIVKNMFNVFLSDSVLVNVKGTTRAGKAGIFVNFPFNYSGKFKMDFFN